MCAPLCMLFLHAPGPAIHVFGVLSIARIFSNTTTGHTLVMLVFHESHRPTHTSGPNPLSLFDPFPSSNSFDQAIP